MMQFSIAACRNFFVKVKPSSVYSGFEQQARYPVLAIEEFYWDVYENEEDKEVETLLLLPSDDGTLRWVPITECVFAGVD